MSPFFIAVSNEAVWAIEMFCDHGCDFDTPSHDGMTPLMYAAHRGFDEICMYLSLRTDNVDEVNKNTGKNVFRIYLERKNRERLKQLLMRKADINFVNKQTGFTPLHWAIEHKYGPKVIKFLLKNGAYPHAEDYEGRDCCDKAILDD